MKIFDILKNEKILIEICKELNKNCTDVNIGYAVHKYTNDKIYLIKIYKIDKNQTYSERILRCGDEYLNSEHEYVELVKKITNRYLRKNKLEIILNV